MEVTKTLSYTAQMTELPLRHVLHDANGYVVGGIVGTSKEHAAALSQEIYDRYNAPLIILGRATELRETFNVRGEPEAMPQWHVVYAGERKLMTRHEIDEAVYVMEFTE